MILYRHAPTGLPFFWETADQPEARWHGPGEGPAHYLADTPDGAWAELLRHEEITAPEELKCLTTQYRPARDLPLRKPCCSAASRPILLAETKLGDSVTLARLAFGLDQPR